MTLGQRIARFRKDKGLSQEALADLVGVSRQAVSKWELDEAQPDAAKLVLLARALEVTTDQLLLGNDTDPDAPAETEPPTSSNERSTAPGPNYPAALARFIKKHGYKAGYLLIVYGLVLLLFAGAGFTMIHGFFSAADESMREFNGYQNEIHFGQTSPGNIQFEPAPGVSLSPEEIALIEDTLAQGHHPDQHHPGYGGLTISQREVHAFPVALQRAFYVVPAIPAIIGLALVVTGVVVIVKFKRDEE